MTWSLDAPFAGDIDSIEIPPPTVEEGGPAADPAANNPADPAQDETPEIDMEPEEESN